MSKALIALLFLAAVAMADNWNNMNCYRHLDSVIFDLTQLQNTNADYNHTLPDNTTLYWNLCQYTIQGCKTNQTFGVVSSQTDCTRLTDSDENKIQDSYIVGGHPENGISITFGQGEAYNGTASTLRVNIQCDKNEATKFKVLSVTSEGSVFTVTGSSQFGCPKVDLGIIFDFLNEHKVIVIIICVVIGAVLCFVGYSLSKAAFFLMGFSLTFGPLIMLIFIYVVKSTTTMQIRLIIAAICAGIGCLSGIIATRLEKVGYFLTGYLLGYCIANFVYIAVLAKFGYALFIIGGITIVAGTIIGLLMAVYKDPILIIATSVFGSLLMVRPFFMLSPDFLNEYQIAEMLKINQIQSIPIIMYIYLGTWAVFTVVGMVVQGMRKKAELNKQKEPEYLTL